MRANCRLFSSNPILVVYWHPSCAFASNVVYCFFYLEHCYSLSQHGKEGGGRTGLHRTIHPLKPFEFLYRFELLMSNKWKVWERRKNAFVMIGLSGFQDNYWFHIKLKEHTAQLTFWLTPFFSKRSKYF